MKIKHWDIFAGVLPVFFLCWWGCDSKRPLAPARPIALTVSIPPTNELRSSLLTSGANELLYRVDGIGGAPIKGTIGPFSTAAATGSIDFNLNLPSGGKGVLSVQINDAGTHQPLALGAVGLDFSSAAPVTDFVVEMGSVTRNCYYTNGNSFAYGYTYGFSGDNTFFGQTLGPAYDVNFNYIQLTVHPAPTNGSNYYFFMEDASGNTTTSNASIAYMGNGKFVDYDYVPPDSQFYTSSMIAKAAVSAPVSDLQINDIYCVKLGTIPGGHAWVQMTNQNTFPSAPSFVFRVNGTLPYYGYDQTSADAAATCGGTW